MEFLQGCWESALKQRYLFDFLTLFLNHPEWQENEYRRKAFLSLKASLKEHAPNLEVNTLKDRELSPIAESREAELLLMLNWFEAMDEFRIEPLATSEFVTIKKAIDKKKKQ